MTYGSSLVPRYHLDKANVIVSIDADFLGTWLSPVEFTKQFSRARRLSKQNKKFNKLIAFESVMTLTGTNADTRVAIRPNDGAAVALAIAHVLVQEKHASSDKDAVEALTSLPVPKLLRRGQESTPKALSRTAHALWEARGHSLVLAGSAPSQSEKWLWSPSDGGEPPQQSSSK